MEASSGFASEHVQLSSSVVNIILVAVRKQKKTQLVRMKLKTFATEYDEKV